MNLCGGGCIVGQWGKFVLISLFGLHSWICRVRWGMEMLCVDVAFIFGLCGFI